MIVEFSLCDKCGNNPDGHLQQIRVHCWKGDQSVDKELLLCPHCAQEFLTTVEIFKSAAEDLKKRSRKELAVHMYNTVGQAKDSNSNENP